MNYCECEVPMFARSSVDKEAGTETCLKCDGVRKYDPRSAGARYDWDSMTKDDAIEIVLCRLEDLFEVLNEDRPTRVEGLEPFKQMVRWAPILADYAVFARRANQAEAKAREDHRRMQNVEARLYQETREAKDARYEATSTVRGLERHLRSALALIEEGKAEDGKDLDLIRGELDGTPFQGTPLEWDRTPEGGRALRATVSLKDRKAFLKTIWEVRTAVSVPFVPLFTRPFGEDE